jgi:hypothetical protein
LVEEFASAPDTVDQRQVKARSRTRLASAFSNHTFRKLYDEDQLLNWRGKERAREKGGREVQLSYQEEDFTRKWILQTIHVNSIASTACAMPIRLLLEHDHAFTPEDVKVLIEAFEETLRALNLVDREDRLTMTVAKLIIQFEGRRARP